LELPEKYFKESPSDKLVSTALAESLNLKRLGGWNVKIGQV
jgi:hypothetical protein